MAAELSSAQQSHCASRSTGTLATRTFPPPHSATTYSRVTVYLLQTPPYTGHRSCPIHTNTVVANSPIRTLTVETSTATPMKSGPMQEVLYTENSLSMSVVTGRNEPSLSALVDLLAQVCRPRRRVKGAADDVREDGFDVGFM